MAIAMATRGVLATMTTAKALVLVLLLTTLVQWSVAAPVDGVVIVRGNKMYNHKSGERFFIKGVRFVAFCLVLGMYLQFICATVCKCTHVSAALDSLVIQMTYEYAVSDTYYNQYSKQVIAENLKGLDFNTLRVYNINPDESYKSFMSDMAALGVYVLVSASPDNDEYFGKYRFSTITKARGPDGKVVTNSNGAKSVDQTETCYPALLLEYGKKVCALSVEPETQDSD